jgi:DNA mismatch repair protein MutL
MVLIDQHAAHERAAFEKMRAQLQQGGVESQNLLIPQLIELPYDEAVLLEGNLHAIHQFGFVVEVFGPHTFAIKAVPALLPPGDCRGIVKEMIGEIAEIGQSSELRHELEERLMTLACHGVVRANQKLDPEEIRALLRELDRIDFATQCPHGRPVLLEFTREQLERMFKRT